MNQSKRWTPSALLLLAACASPDGALDTTGDAVTTLDEAWVGVRDDGAACPAAPAHWRLELHPVPLHRFCTYVPTSTAADHRSLGDPTMQGLTRAGEGLVAALSTPPPGELARVMGASLHDTYRRQLRLPTAPVVTSTAPVVRVALVDTAPAGAPSPRSPHSPALAALARDVLCDGAACAAEIVPYLGMPRRRGGQIDLVNGGYYGTLFELAQAIAAAARDSSGPTVINLSLGWEPQAGHAVPAAYWAIVADNVSASRSIPAPVRAVLTAVAYARCRGALVVAAAGNDPMGRGLVQGPTLPAAWATLGAPSDAQCRAVFQVAHRIDGGALLVAASGMAGDRARVANHRRGALAELSAPATAAVGSNGGHVLTGTSIAAVTLSSVAAAVWAIAPTWTPSQVYEAIYSSARTTPLTAEICAPTGCRGARAVLACQAQAAACTKRGTCAPMTCPTPTAPGWDATMFAAGRGAILQRGGGYLEASSAFTATSTFGASCGATRVMNRPGTGCPFDASPAYQHQDTGPQPGMPICPACFVTLHEDEAYFHMWVADDVPGGWVHRPMLVLDDGREQVRFALGGPLEAGSSRVANIGRPELADPVESVFLAYELEVDGRFYSASEPILVEH